MIYIKVEFDYLKKKKKLQRKLNHNDKWYHYIILEVICIFPTYLQDFHNKS